MDLSSDPIGPGGSLTLLLVHLVVSHDCTVCSGQTNPQGIVTALKMDNPVHVFNCVESQVSCYQMFEVSRLHLPCTLHVTQKG